MSTDREYRIVPARRFATVNFKELWRYRGLFLVFTWRDISVRYKQTVLGILWALIQPFLTMVVFTFIFNRIANIQSGDGTPYPIFLYVGLLLWQYFSGTLANASASMVANASMLQKIYFPRLIIPTSAALAGLVDLFIGSLILGGLMVYYGYVPHLTGVLILPVLLLITILVALGWGLILASLNVKYRDVRHALPFVINILMYVTPVIYAVELLDRYPIVKTLMIWLNPISGVISNARAGVLGASPIDWWVLGISALMSIVYFVIGLHYFRSTERFFADIV